MIDDKSLVSVRIDAELKEEAEVILDDMGLSISTAVNMFLNTVVRKKEIPFSVRLDDELD